MSDSTLEILPELKEHLQVNLINSEQYAAMDRLGLRLADDGFVKWKADASTHPRNWSVGRKTFDTGLIFVFDLFTYVTLVERGVVEV